MKRNIRVAMLMFLLQLLNVDINKQAALEIDYLKEENQSLKFQFKRTGKRLFLTDEQRKNLAIKGKAFGKRMYEVVTIVRPETLLKWYSKFVAAKFDSSKSPTQDKENISRRYYRSPLRRMDGSSCQKSYRMGRRA